VAAGLLGSGLVAGFASGIAAAASGLGQELLNAAVLFVAVVMLACHNIWMSRHGKELAARVYAVGQAVMGGSRPLYALAVVVAVAVLREGSETVLFVYGIAVGGDDGAGALLLGSIVGLVGGLALGSLLYFGLLQIPMKRLFAVTNTLILLLAAGMAAQCAGFLVQADILPAWGDALWNTSGVLSEHSIPGRILHTLVGYVAEPTGMQVAFYVATLLAIAGLMQWLGGRPGRDATRSPAQQGIVLLTASAVSLMALQGLARAEFKVRSPILDYREFEIEHNGDVTFDKSKSGKNNNQSYTNEIEVGLLPNWVIGLEGEMESLSGQNFRYSATTVENYFQFTPQGKYWADLGFFAEYSRAAQRNAADSVTFGPLVQKEVPDVFGLDTLHTVNVLFSKDVGRLAQPNTPLFVAWQSRVRLDPMFEPGVEFYGAVDDIARPGKLADQQHRAGPVLAGLYLFPSYGKIKYEVGYLFGLTRSTEKGTVRWKLEYEISF
jgi:high-affinity iron transporter